MAAYVQFIGTSSPSLSAEICAPPSVWFDSIVSGHREFNLHHEMKVPVYVSDGLFILETRDVPIIAYGESLADAMTDFQNQFGIMWDRIAMESDDKLTLDAQVAKHSQANMVESITQPA